MLYTTLCNVIVWPSSVGMGLAIERCCISRIVIERNCVARFSSVMEL